MEYYQYFRLDGPPFQPASPHSAVYFSPTHLQGLATLESGLTTDLSGLTLLTGEAGIGKTTLIYSLLQRDFKRARIAHIDDPKLSFLEMLQVVLSQLNLYSAGSTKLDYLKVLDHLLDLHGKEERIAIVVDEAQALSDDVLEELRLLSNRGQREDRVLQLILVGQPELAERLKRPELRQLNQRISSRGMLKPLTTVESIMYVECRLNVQGGKSSAIFEPHALNHLLKRSDGIPRKINMLCHGAMMAAFYAGDRKITVRLAKKIAADYHDSVGITKPKDGARRLVMSALIAAVALASLLAVGILYPKVWSDLFGYRSAATGDADELPAQPVEIARHRKKDKHFAAVEQAGSGAKLQIDNNAAPHLVELQASIAPGAAPLAASGSDPAGPATAPGVSAIPNTPAAAAASAAIQKPIGVPAAPPLRSQITVQSGDTLEDIAIRYLGSKSGMDELIKANPQLTNIDQLSVGQIIYLPHSFNAKAAHDQALIARPAATVNDSPE
ncbi:MAG TPA: AAA family ATPase [Candidatus Binataceae bacterium]|nr:AAA family ATPase [Candidatus Binataceae bacterium]